MFLLWGFKLSSLGTFSSSFAFCVHSKSETAQILNRLHTDSSFRTNAGAAADTYIRSNIGASDIILKDLFNIKPKHTPLND